MMLYVLAIVIMNSTGVVSLKNRVQNRVREHHKVAVLGYGTRGTVSQLLSLPCQSIWQKQVEKERLLFAFKIKRKFIMAGGTL